LGDYEWWTDHGRWVPSPAAVCICLLLFAMSVIGDKFFPHRQPVASGKEWGRTVHIDDRPITRPKRPPPTFENVRLVAEVLSRINAGLIESHFLVGPITAREYMERLIGEGHFGEINADGWHYPLTRQMQRRRRSTENAKCPSKNKLSHLNRLPVPS
jgi:hypothetical protein